jgi:hypothetical protein
MARVDLLSAAAAAFARDRAAEPPLTLRGGHAVDGYGRAEPFDPAVDQPSDSYLEQFAFWGLGYLDAQSWRHYLPRLIEYALAHPGDPSMVTEALVRSLRPPDRHPARLASLTPPQEAVVAAFLKEIARSSVAASADAEQALLEWWGPAPRSRPTPEETAARHAAPIRYRRHDRERYSLELPDTFTGSGERDIPEEARRIETWAGWLGGDAHTVVAVTVSPLAARPFAEALAARAALFREPPTPRAIDVPGAREARRMDGLTPGDSPAEPQALTLVLAATARDAILLTIRGWPRDDLTAAARHVVSSFQVSGTPGA